MNKPKIRFKGFEGEWVEKKLGDVAESFKYGINAAAISYDGKNKYLRITDIDDYTREFNQNDITSPDADLSSCDDYIMQNGDIVIARTGASVGKSYIYKERDGKVYFAGFLIRMRLIEGIAKKFVFQNTLTKQYNNHVKLVSQRSGQPGMNVNEIKSYSLKIPSLPEQQAIAQYFTSLDKEITSSASRLASLKQLKAASLQAMFPQEGETVPKIRFEGFEGEWEKVKLEEIYERRIEKNDLSYQADKIISVANMYFRPISYVSTIEYLKSYNVFKLGDIAFEGHKSKNYAHGRFVENTIGSGIVSHVFVVLKRKDENYDLTFWKYLINDENTMGGILSRCTKTSTMMNDIVVDDFLKESVLAPTYEEQNRIGKYFASLDKQITLLSQRLEKLKQIKSACLDKMFV